MRVYQYLVPAVEPEENCSFQSDGAGGVIVTFWDAGVLGPQPTEQEVTTALASPGFATWLEEHGGDPVKTLRRQAKEALDATTERDAVLRAAILELLDYAKTIAQEHNDLLTWLGGQTTLTGRGQLSNFSAPTPTAAQARNAIKARIDAGEADS